MLNKVTNKYTKNRLCIHFIRLQIGIDVLFGITYYFGRVFCKWANKDFYMICKHGLLSSDFSQWHLFLIIIRLFLTFLRFSLHFGKYFSSKIEITENLYENGINLCRILKFSSCKNIITLAFCLKLNSNIWNWCSVWENSWNIPIFLV